MFSAEYGRLIVYRFTKSLLSPRAVLILGFAPEIDDSVSFAKTPAHAISAMLNNSIFFISLFI